MKSRVFVRNIRLSFGTSLTVERLASSSISLSSKMSALTSLAEMAAEIVVLDYRLLSGNLNCLPRTILETLVTASIRNQKILTLHLLVSEWPFKHLVLQDCQGFGEMYAVLFAFILQKSDNKLEVVDMRGCRTGIAGTTAFCKLALGLPVSQNDVSDMSVIDCRPLTETDKHVEYLKVKVPPLTVIMDCYVNPENFELVKQGLVKHTILNIKICSLCMVELGRRKVRSLASLLECDIITCLDVSMNSLENEGITSLSSYLKTFRNLTELNLGYNRLKHDNTSGITALADAIKHLSSLKKLTLTENILGSEICTILRNIASFLTHLVLNGCGTRSDELNEMCNMQPLHHLEHLELSTNALVNCMKPMSKFVCKSSKTLKHLSIEDNMFVSSSVADLRKMAKKLEKLETLSICYNHLIPDDVMIIQNVLANVKVINRDWLF
ncbi:uncharacterized protein LOC116295040 [Actinia tenebrosa]|uniref:Uncharacterized protein LOC116295040 n=1 Tax=Actinia tenebrosa TaxID=6105 RepID=A0A6P8HQE7_ACTTE|nr:uncharacterized protein LOC116295040 [Actinia tenebrosa]